jgi:DNA helicase II / ATP-dependent DNA helicase PcrA
MDVTTDLSYAISKLNDQQKLVIETIEGPLLVIAGPGTGKTQALTLRIANILNTTDTDPSSILCLTFTDTATKNMQKRLSSLIGATAYKVRIMTFHGFALSLTQDYFEQFNFFPSFKPLQDLDKFTLFESIFKTLSFSDPLRSYHPKEGFTYMRDVISRIGELKESGINPQELKIILEQNARISKGISDKLQEIIPSRVDKKNAKTTIVLLQELCTEYIENSPFEHVLSFSQAMFKTLEKIKLKLQENEKQGLELFSKWRKSNLIKVEGKVTLTYLEKEKKYKNLATIYKTYQEKLHANGWFDFQDMMLSVVEALQKKPDFKLQIQSLFQYLLVDEFQDTNLVQMDLLSLLSDNPVYEGSPNIMAVGDDDQSIYKFAGANLDNIYFFTAKYPTLKTITLSTNYRSGKKIVDTANKLAHQLSQRYDSSKAISSGVDDPSTAIISTTSYQSSEQELLETGKKIQSLLSSGVGPSEIAVISNKHDPLKKLVPILSQLNIPIYYEKGSNILTNSYILEIYTICQFLLSLKKGKSSISEFLLPDILHFEFFQIVPLDVWKLSVQAKETKKTWFETMLESENSVLKNTANWLLTLSAQVNNKSAEWVISVITGVLPLEINGGEVYSNFKTCYFETTSTDTEQVLFLSALKTLYNFIRTYQSTPNISISDLVIAIDKATQLKVPILDNSPFNSSQNAVSLMTAHGSKGLEFEHVFILDVSQQQWFGRGAPVRLDLPTNIPVVKATIDEDDFIRLLYVAITRAKQNCYLSYHNQTQDSKQKNIAGVLDGLVASVESSKLLESEVNELLTSDRMISSLEPQPIITEHRDLFAPQLDNYLLSVTHLENFINLADAGPKVFFEKNLLTYPQPKSPSLAYGTVVHSIMQLAQNYIRTHSTPPPFELLQTSFEKQILEQYLDKTDETLFLEKGLDSLKRYYSTHITTWDSTGLCEVDFKSQNVFSSGARLTGKIDRMEVDYTQKIIKVFDFKTGKSFSKNWETTTDDREKIKRDRYLRQLAFYKILLKNSRDWGHFTMETGTLHFVDKQSKLELLSEVTWDVIGEEKLDLLAQKVYTMIQNLDFPGEEILTRFKNKSGEFDWQSNQDFIEWILENK